jgi:hypothetical protein
MNGGFDETFGDRSRKTLIASSPTRLTYLLKPHNNSCNDVDSGDAHVDSGMGILGWYRTGNDYRPRAAHSGSYN